MQSPDIKQQVEEIFARHGLMGKLRGDLPVTTPLTGEQIATVTTDPAGAVHAMVARSVAAQGAVES